MDGIDRILIGIWLFAVGFLAGWLSQQNLEELATVVAVLAR